MLLAVNGPASRPALAQDPAPAAAVAKKNTQAPPPKKPPATTPQPVSALPTDKTEWQVSEQAPEPEIYYLWVNSHGEIEKASWKKKAEILWKSLAPNEPSKLRVWFAVPAQLKIESVKSARGEVKSGTALSGAPWADTAMEWTSSNAENSLDVVVRDAAGKTEEKSLVVDNDQSTTAYVSDPSCRDAGIRIFSSQSKEAKKDGGPAKDLFVGARCKPAAGGAVHIRLDYVGAEKLSVEGSLRAVRSQPGAVELDTTLPPKYDGSLMLLGKLHVGKAESSFYISTRKDRRWGASVGLSATYISYQEPASQVSLSETGVTGKLGASFRLSTDWDLSGNAFATLFPITVSPAGLASARFWGLNARVGYAFKRFSQLTLSASLGYYFMGLATSGDYGISAATGPQIFLVASSAAGASRAYAAYLKFSAISSGFTIAPANHEVALGGAYQIARLWERALSLTLDLSQMSFTTPDGSASFQSVTASMGLQLRL
jgi:hypothetical protein